ncbi:flagellar assembly protein FliX [Nisaea acidiphila]|uniref:Flagellar assembly protein FliX n=1 Tax=Nisaea acidiphila TaxID=1862145 RepID=A0A9J7AUI8_9PROT|nr:flagellar assembly protein FliX [Nisaea acidiphila]UUX50490.1 flagellar assembly protein FliX [Nisaea acidiphila]
MKVDPSRRVSTPATRKTSKSGSTSGTQFSGLLEETQESKSAQAARSAMPVDGLLAVQEADPDGRGGNREGQQRGEDLLARLERIRDGLLLGAIPESELRSLAQTIGQTRERGFTDPRLGQILDEIELRARVELAKLGTFL